MKRNARPAAKTKTSEPVKEWTKPTVYVTSVQQAENGGTGSLDLVLFSS